MVRLARLARFAIRMVAAFVFGYLLAIIVDQASQGREHFDSRYFVDVMRRSYGIGPAAPGAPDLGQAWAAAGELDAARRVDRPAE